MQTPPNIQIVLDKAKAKEIAAYIERRNKERPDSKATLNVVCTRFRLNHTDALRIIDSVDFLTLSEFAYKPPPKNSDVWADHMIAAWFPQVWPDAPKGKRLVSIIGAVT